MKDKAKIICANTLLKSFNALIDKINLDSQNFEENNILIVPDKFTLNAEHLVFERKKIESVFSLKVYSFTKLINEICENELKKYNVINKNAGVLLISNIILENNNKFVKFCGAENLSNFSADIYNTILQLKSSGIKPDELNTAKENINFKFKLDDIKLIYEEYEKALKNNGIDGIDTIDVFLAKSKQSELLKNSNVFIGMFHDYSYKQIECIKAISKVAKSLTISLSSNQKQANSHIYLVETYQQVISALQESHIEYEVQNIFDDEQNDITYLAQNLFGFNTVPKKLESEIKIVEAENEVEEVDFIARQIKDKVLTQNYCFKDFNIACCDFENYMPTIKKIFDRYTIPYYFDYSNAFSNHFFGKFLINVLDIITTNFEKTSVFTFIQSPFTCCDKKDIYDLLNHYEKYNIDRSLFLKDIEDTKLNQTQNRCLHSLISLKQNISRQVSVNNYIESIKAFLTDIDYEKVLEKLVSNVDEIDFKNSCLQVKEKLETIFETMQEYAGESKLSFAYFSSLLKSMLENVKINLVPLGVNRVFIGDVNSSTFYPAKNMIVIGAIDGLFPNYKNDCGIITDSEIKLMTAKNLLSPSIKFVNKGSKYMCFETCLTFTKSLTISYSSLQFGTSTRPSEIFSAIKKLFVDNDGNAIDFYHVSNEVENLILNDSDNSKFNYVFESKYNLDYASNVNFSNNYIDTAKTIKLGQKKQQVVNDYELNCDAKKLFFPKLTASVSQIQSYFACPYKHFTQYGLRLKEKEVYGLKKVDFGNFLHRVAELYVNTIIGSKKMDVDEIINQAVQENIIVKQDSLDVYKLKSLKQEAKKLITRIDKQIKNSNFAPKQVEYEFKDSETYNDIALIGKVDRYDIFDKLFVVFDYKTGKDKFSYKSCFYGEKIQLIIYLDILERTLGLTNVGAYYFPIKNKFIEEDATDEFSGVLCDDETFTVLRELDKNFDDKDGSEVYKIKFNKDGTINSYSKEDILSPKEYSDLKAYIKKLYQTAIDEILDKNIAPSPTEDACRYCPYQTLCLFNAQKQGIRMQKAEIKKATFALISKKEGE